MRRRPTARAAAARRRCARGTRAGARSRQEGRRRQDRARKTDAPRPTPPSRKRHAVRRCEARSGARPDSPKSDRQGRRRSPTKGEAAKKPRRRPRARRPRGRPSPDPGTARLRPRAPVAAASRAGSPSRRCARARWPSSAPRLAAVEAALRQGGLAKQALLLRRTVLEETGAERGSATRASAGGRGPVRGSHLGADEAPEAGVSALEALIAEAQAAGQAALAATWRKDLVERAAPRPAPVSDRPPKTPADYYMAAQRMLIRVPADGDVAPVLALLSHAVAGHAGADAALALGESLLRRQAAAPSESGAEGDGAGQATRGADDRSAARGVRERGSPFAPRAHRRPTRGRAGAGWRPGGGAGRARSRDHCRCARGLAAAAAAPRAPAAPAGALARSRHRAGQRRPGDDRAPIGSRFWPSARSCSTPAASPSARWPSA